MKTKAAILAALAALAANAVQMATENWVSNRLTEATAPIRESVAALNSATQTIQAAVDELSANTYTKGEADAKIVELAPAPGDYANVSNRAMTALQSHQSLAPATNYTDSATNALAASMLSRSEAEAGFTAWAITPAKYGDADIVLAWKTAGDGFQYAGWVPYPAGSPMNIGRPMGTADATNLVWRENEDAFMAVSATRTRLRPTPAMEAAWSAKPDTQAVESIVRELSLGGIWDTELEVWWTPRMRNGSLTYEATTNVNMEANQ